MKLIDMKKVLNELCLSHKDIIYIDKNETAERIRKIPSIDIDRPQGEWVRAMDGYDMHVKCTSCFKTYDWDTQAQYYNYCPYCGARMKGADDDTDNV